MFGELTKAAHDDGLFVMARMDSSRTDEDFFKAHPDLFAQASNWDDPVDRQWMTWNCARRAEFWDQNNRVTRAAGGPDCIWSGMMGGAVTAQAQSFRDLRAIARRAELLMLDHQHRATTPVSSRTATPTNACTA